MKLEENRTLSLVLYDWDTTSATCVDVQHNASQCQGLNVVAIVVGDLCPPDTPCAWCRGLGVRIAARTRTASIAARVWGAMGSPIGLGGR